MEKAKKKNLISTIVCIVAIVVIIASSFFIGYFVGDKTASKSSGTSTSSGDATTADLSTVEWILSAIQNYYYYDFDEETISDVIAEIVSHLDEYSAYYTAEEYQALIDDNSGSKSGIGITYNFIEGTGIKIISVMGNSPAYYAGLEKGDVIASAECESASIDFTAATSTEASAYFSDRQTDEIFTVKLESGVQMSLAKTEYEASYVAMYSRDTAWNFETDDDNEFSCVQSEYSGMSYLPEDTAYISLIQFYGSETVNQFGELIEKFNAEGYTSLILDLRNDGGGYVSLMQGISGCFVKDGGIAMVAKYKDGSQTNYAITKQPSSHVLADGVSVYVLANSGTASASEALIGTLISYGICDYEDIFISDFGEEYTNWYTAGGATLKTAQTYGKGIMQSTYAVNGDYFSYSYGALKLTTAQIYWQNGKCIHGVGLTEADGCTIVPDVEWTATKDDNELRQVLSIIASR